MSKILVIEDEQNIRETLKDVIEFAGYDVFIAVNGKEGYDSILNNKPDLVLCDVNMPELNGFELLESINLCFRSDQVPPFLFLTAKVEMEEMRFGMNLGADDYICKPFSVEEVLKAIKVRLAKRENISVVNNFNNESCKKLALPCDEGLELVSFDEIIKCQADRSYCNFYFTNKSKVIVSKPMKDFEEILLERNFFKVHKSTIVNLDHVKKYVRGKAGYLLMCDDSIVNIAVRKKEVLLNHLKSIS